MPFARSLTHALPTDNDIEKNITRSWIQSMSVAGSTVFLRRVTVGIEMMVYSRRWLGWVFDEACECVMMYEDCHDQTRFCPALGTDTGIP